MTFPTTAAARAKDLKGLGATVERAGPVGSYAIQCPVCKGFMVSQGFRFIQLDDGARRFGVHHQPLNDVRKVNAVKAMMGGKGSFANDPDTYVERGAVRWYQARAHILGCKGEVDPGRGIPPHIDSPTKSGVLNVHHLHANIQEADTLGELKILEELTKILDHLKIGTSGIDAFCVELRRALHERDTP